MTSSASIAGYSFKKPALLAQALTHPSHSKTGNNQRLEFLGDAVLGLVIAQALYEQYPNEQEGELARRQAALVCGQTLVQIAQKLELGALLKLSESEIASGGRETPSNLEDACEALIGAIFLDGGLEAANTWILEHWRPLIGQLSSPPKDAKTNLQEWAQSLSLGLPLYEVVNQKGPSHAPEFTVKVTVESKGEAQATAGSKRAAEQLAAAELWKQLT